MKARVKWVENACLMGESGSGHSVIMDSSPAFGGRDLGIRPMEMVLLGLGGCTTLDILMILGKQRQHVTDCVIEVESERREEEPKIFTKIHLHYKVTGKDLKENHVKKAVSLSAEKYCSVSAMLEKSAEITHDYEIIEAE